VVWIVIYSELYAGLDQLLPVSETPMAIRRSTHLQLVVRYYQIMTVTRVRHHTEWSTLLVRPWTGSSGGATPSDVLDASTWGSPLNKSTAAATNVQIRQTEGVQVETTHGSSLELFLANGGTTHTDSAAPVPSLPCECGGTARLIFANKKRNYRCSGCHKVRTLNERPSDLIPVGRELYSYVLACSHLTELEQRAGQVILDEGQRTNRSVGILISERFLADELGIANSAAWNVLRALVDKQCLHRSDDGDSGQMRSARFDLVTTRATNKIASPLYWQQRRSKDRLTLGASHCEVPQKRKTSVVAVHLKTRRVPTLPRIERSTDGGATYQLVT
jgi:hypothetical protein